MKELRSVVILILLIIQNTIWAYIKLLKVVIRALVDLHTRCLCRTLVISHCITKSQILSPTVALFVATLPGSDLKKIFGHFAFFKTTI